MLTRRYALRERKPRSKPKPVIRKRGHKDNEEVPSGYGLKPLSPFPAISPRTEASRNGIVGMLLRRSARLQGSNSKPKSQDLPLVSAFFMNGYQRFLENQRMQSLIAQSWLARLSSCGVSTNSDIWDSVKNLAVRKVEEAVARAMFLKVNEHHNAHAQEEPKESKTTCPSEEDMWNDKAHDYLPHSDIRFDTSRVYSRPPGRKKLRHLNRITRRLKAGDRGKEGEAGSMAGLASNGSQQRVDAVARKTRSTRVCEDKDIESRIRHTQLSHASTSDGIGELQDTERGVKRATAAGIPPSYTREDPAGCLLGYSGKTETGNIRVCVRRERWKLCK